MSSTGISHGASIFLNSSVGISKGVRINITSERLKKRIKLTAKTVNIIHGRGWCILDGRAPDALGKLMFVILFVARFLLDKTSRISARRFTSS